MSDHSSPRYRAFEQLGALDGDDLLGLGTRKAISSGESAVYYPFPQPFARERGVDPGTDAEVFLHPETNVLLVVPVDG